VTFFTKWLNDNTDWNWAGGTPPNEVIKNEYMTRIKDEDANEVYADLIKKYGEETVKDALRAPDLSAGAMTPPPFESYVETRKREDTNPDAVEIMQKLRNVSNIGIGTHGLVRGFHINKILSRMFMPWNSHYIPNRMEMYRDENGKPNEKFFQAYKLWKDYVADAVASIPSQKGKDRNTGQDVDMVMPAKQALDTGRPGKNPLVSMNKAWGIIQNVFGAEGVRGGIARDYSNFFELLHDEFTGDKDHEDAARHYGQISSGDRTLPGEDIEKFIKDRGATVIKGPESMGL